MTETPETPNTPPDESREQEAAEGRSGGEPVKTDPPANPPTDEQDVERGVEKLNRIVGN